MSAIVGERDRLLRATIPRNISPMLGKKLLLDVDPTAFHAAADGTVSPSVATFTASTIGFDAAVLWSITSGGALLGTAPNVRTLAASSMTATSVKVTATVVYEGQAYIATRTIFKLSDGAAGAPGAPGLPGKDATAADLTPESLVSKLEGRITDSQLYADLRSRISLITDPVTVPGSVQARIKEETDSRVVAIGAEATTRAQAIDKEVSDRIAAILAESGARTTYVQNYTFSKAETNSALSIQATQIAAAYTAYADLKSGQAISAAAADVRTYSYSKADTSSAISAAESRLRSEFVGSGGATEAYVQNWSYSKAQSDSAEATQTATLTTSYKGYADQKKTEAVADAAADVRTYAYSKAAMDSSEAAQLAALTTSYTAYADAARAAAVSTASADVRQYAYSKSDTTSAIAASESRLRSEFVGSGGATEAYVTNYAYSKAQVDQSEALQSSTLTASYTSAINGIKVGARNLYTRTQPFSDPTTSGSIFAERLADGFTLVGVSGGTGFQRMAVDLAPGPYTLSFNLRLRDGPGMLRLDLADTAAQDLSATTTNSHYELHFNVTNGNLAWLDFDKMGPQGYYFSQFKLEAGNKATSYTQAPEDVAGDIAAAVVSANAYTNSYAYAKSDAAGAFASMSSQITAAYQQAVAVSNADVRSYSVAKSELAGAIAQSTSSLSTTVAGHTSTIQQQATSLNGLGGQLTWKIDADNHVTGFGLASTPINGVPYSTMIFNVDVLAVALPGAAGKPIFTVGQVNGQQQAVFRTDLIVDGGLTARMLKIGTSDNIIPDPQFRDLAWWGRAGSTVGQWADAGLVTNWKGGASLYLASSAGEVESNTKPFQMLPGATYLIEVQVNVSTDWNGRLGAYLYIPEIQWYRMIAGPNIPQTGQSWSNGLPVLMNGNGPKGFISFQTTYKVPEVGVTVASTCIKIMNSHTAGSCEIGSLCITRVVDQTLIGPGSVLTKHLDISTGGDIHSGQTGFDLGDGFWLEGEGRGHGARMSIGRQNGRKIIIDPANNRLELVDPQIGANMTASISPANYSIVRNANQQFTDVYAGTFTLTIGNAGPDLDYTWDVVSESGNVIVSRSGSSKSVVVYVTGKLSLGQEVNVQVNGTGRDRANGASRGASANINIQVQ